MKALITYLQGLDKLQTVRLVIKVLFAIWLLYNLIYFVWWLFTAPDYRNLNFRIVVGGIEWYLVGSYVACVLCTTIYWAFVGGTHPMFDWKDSDSKVRR